MLKNKESLEEFLSNVDCNEIGSDIKFLRGKIDNDLFIRKLQASIGIIEETFKIYTPEQICVSFNGGKDCCVVLYLFHLVASSLGIKFPLNVLLIKVNNQFDEMSDFIDRILVDFYKDSLKFIILDEGLTKSMKDCLSELKQSNPEINAILMGVRRTDGEYFKNMKSFASTDKDWPKFMRVNPILDWTFSEIWYFIRVLKLHYCILYDQGYTSIDNKLNTVKNKELLQPDGVTYLPAYMLQNDAAERYSRKKL